MPDWLLTERAREQRHDMPDSERRLWYLLRSRRFQGYKFRRQVPIGPFIADFACKSRHLIIEVDGDAHGSDHQHIRDSVRTDWLERRGWRVMRFWSHQLLALDDVSAEIFQALDQSPHPNPLP